MTKATPEKVLIAKNKKAYFDYEILDTFEAGLVLTGAEVKAVKKHLINLKGSFVSAHDTELFTDKIHISPYQAANQPDYKPERRRKLLLKRKEMDKIISQLDTQGLTVVPLEIYLKKGLVKISIGLVRGRKKYDKREVLKKRTQEREIQKILKKY